MCIASLLLIATCFGSLKSHYQAIYISINGLNQYIALRLHRYMYYHLQLLICLVVHKQYAVDFVTIVLYFKFL
jgi:hypothetical protein